MSAEQATALITAVAALAVSVTGLLGASLALLQQARSTHALVNSRMTEMLQLTKTAAFARGRLENPGPSAERRAPSARQD